MKSIAQRAHKVRHDALARLPAAGCTFRDWFGSLPGFLGADEFARTVDAIVAARAAHRPFVFAFGGHVVKTGCSPLIVDLIERGVITAIATNGSGAIHDLELAQTGNTSEEVADTIRDGSFGMVAETCAWMNQAVARAAAAGGLGRAVGQLIATGDGPFRHASILAAAARHHIPATVHVAVGTDTVHVSPDLDGAALGAATLADFHTICGVVAELGAAGGAGSTSGATRAGGTGIAGGAGGVWLNVGSAVIMPEVFLKAVSVARNLGADLDAMQTANFDMFRHYRPAQNVVLRPVRAGQGHSVIGHHEILLPMLRQAIIERLAGD
ncbi:MAG: hypothetical protein CHACPFDD_01258 [Phycisphaerae bacterium]|nr:hypothetical protein [Phycisphaerae bacterium]